MKYFRVRYFVLANATRLLLTSYFSLWLILMLKGSILPGNGQSSIIIFNFLIIVYFYYYIREFTKIRRFEYYSSYKGVIFSTPIILFLSILYITSIPQSIKLISHEGNAAQYILEESESYINILYFVFWGILDGLCLGGLDDFTIRSPTYIARSVDEKIVVYSNRIIIDFLVIEAFYNIIVRRVIFLRKKRIIRNDKQNRRRDMILTPYEIERFLELLSSNADPDDKDRFANLLRSRNIPVVNDRLRDYVKGSI